MSIASELQDKINAKAAIKTAIEAKGVTVGDIKLNQYASKIDEIQQGGTGDWIRPADWLPIDNLVVAGEQKTVGLYAVYPNVNNKGMTNTVAFVVTGNYTVDWGDGVVENFNSNVQAGHIYDYNSLNPSTDCARGYRQAIITITPQSGKNITQILFGRKHSSVVFGRISSQWLDLVIGGASISYFRMQDNNVFPNMLEKVKAMQNITACTNMSYMFSNCSSLQSLDLSSFNTSAVTNMSYMFYNCYSLQSLDLSSFNTSAVTNMAVMFHNCYSLQSLDLSSFNTSAVTNMSTMFYNCSSLQSLDLSNTLLNTISSSANFGNFTNGTISLIKCRLPQVKWSFTVASNPLSAAELNLLFGDLFNLTGQPSQTITITGCTGAATCDRTIATSKNWTVIG